MARLLDGTIFFLTYFLLFYSVFIKFLDKSIAIPIIILIYVCICVCNALANRKRKSIEMTMEEMPVYLALMDRQKQTELFFSLVPDAQKGNFNSPYFTYIENGKRTLVAVLYRYFNLTQEDIASAYREAQKEEVDKIIILTRKWERKTLTLTAVLPIPFYFPDKFTVYKALKKHNALPKKPPLPKKKERQKISIKEQFTAIFTEKRAKYFLFSALTLIIMSFLTPLKNYYLIASIIPFTFSAVCYFYKGNSSIK